MKTKQKSNSFLQERKKLLLNKNGKPVKTAKRLPTIKQLVKKLDQVFSLYIRLRDKGVCFTCGKKDEIKKMQCGHYESRSHYNTRWDCQNANSQCLRCNIFLKGNYPIYSINLEKKYGLGILEDLHLRAQQPFKLYRAWLIGTIGFYENEVKKLEGEK